MSCKMIPGMAVITAPDRKISQVKGTLAAPTITIRAAAHTIRPATMAMTRHRYREMTHCQRERAYRRPTTAP